MAQLLLLASIPAAISEEGGDSLSFWSMWKTYSSTGISPKLRASFEKGMGAMTNSPDCGGLLVDDFVGSLGWLSLVVPAPAGSTEELGSFGEALGTSMRTFGVGVLSCAWPPATGYASKRTARAGANPAMLPIVFASICDSVAKGVPVDSWKVLQDAMPFPGADLLLPEIPGLNYPLLPITRRSPNI
jgi:hypothetical protein